MREDLAMLEVRTGEANDVAVAGAAVDPVLPVDNHILGALDLVEPDRLGMNQPVVLREGRMAVARDARCGRQWHARGIDIGLLNHLAAVFRPFDIDADGDQENDSVGGRGHIAGDAHADQTVGQHENDNRADHRPPDRAAPADHRSAAQHDRSDCLEFPTEAGGRIRVGASKLGGGSKRIGQ